MFKTSDTISYIALAFAGACLLVAFALVIIVLRGQYPLAGSAPLLDKIKMMKAQQAGDYAGPDNTIVIIPAKEGGYTFNVPAIKLPAGMSMTWINKSNDPQVLIADDSDNPNITIQPGKPFVMPIKEGGRSYSWHLASNPQAHVTIYVGGK